MMTPPLAPDALLAAAQRCTDPKLRVKLLEEWSRQYRAKQVREAIIACQGCHLYYTRKNAVPWSGPMATKVAFLGEGPGKDEDRLGVPFVGKAGKLLNHLIFTHLNLTRNDVFVVNTICCRAAERNLGKDKDRPPTEDEIQACSRHRKAQLSLCTAPIVVILGRTALRGALPFAFLKVSRDRGRLFLDLSEPMRPRWYFITYHPSAALRDPEKLQEMEEDFKALARFMNLFPWKETDRDPRPDLSDTAIWQAFSVALATVPVDARRREEAFWLLHGVRCLGARIRIRSDDLPGINIEEAAQSEASAFTVDEIEAMIRQYGDVVAAAAERFREWQDTRTQSYVVGHTADMAGLETVPF